MSSRLFSLSMLIPGLLGCLMLAGCQHHQASQSHCSQGCQIPSQGGPVYNTPTYQEPQFQGPGAAPAYSEPGGSGTRMPLGSGTR